MTQGDDVIGLPSPAPRQSVRRAMILQIVVGSWCLLWVAPGSAVSRRSPGAWAFGRRKPQQLALDFAPAQVRSHGLRDAHTYPQVARGQGASFRVPASQAWGYPSLELRAGNSWPLMGFDCDVPEKVLDALVSNHWEARSDVCPALPEPNMIVQRRSNSHSQSCLMQDEPERGGLFLTQDEPKGSGSGHAGD